MRLAAILAALSCLTLAKPLEGKTGPHGDTVGQRPARSNVHPAIPKTDWIEYENPPGPALIEFRVGLSLTEVSSFRILQDGSVWSYDDTISVIPPGSREVEVQAIIRGWVDSHQALTPSELDGLQSLIRASGALLMPPEPPSSGIGIIGGTDVYWTFSLDGLTNCIHYLMEKEPKPEPIRLIREILDEILFRAGQRWRRDHGLDYTPGVD